MSKILEVSSATFAYEEKNIFGDISLQMEQGQVCCLLGPNGCGKTTLLDCVMGINKLRSGNVRVLDKDINDYKRHQLAQRVAYVPQIHNRTFPYTVLQIVMMGRTAYTGFWGEPKHSDEEIARQSLREVGMEKYADTPYTKLSGGEVQLVMLARALGQQTDIIVMDEPTAHLDYRNELIFLETIARLCRNSSVSVLMATHEPAHAFYFESKGLAVKVALMCRGAMVAVGVPGGVLTEENLADVYGVQAKITGFINDNGQEIKDITLLRTLS